MDDGWGDDDFDVDVDVDVDAALGDIEPYATMMTSEGNETGAAPVILEPKSNDEAHQHQNLDDGWDDEDLDIADIDVPNHDPIDPTTSSLPGNHRHKELSITEQDIRRTLVDYMDSLPRVVASLNALLEAEYNTYDHALHLHEYYDSHPQLRDYTVETELPRMDYLVVGIDNMMLCEKKDVADFISNQPNTILFRCANQSLLADVLTVLTGPDRFIRTQHLATAVASTCKFTLYATHVRCDCRLNLSLPGISGQRVDVAHLDFTIEIHPGIPNVHYQLGDVVLLVDNSETDLLMDSAIFLASMEPSDDFIHEFGSYPSNADAFRDSLLLQLSKTQQIVQSSQTGLSSAWKQLDSVANVTRKLDFVKRVGGGLLPSLHSIDLISSEEEQVWEAYPIIEKPHRSITSDTPISSEHSRPAPIIGGFLMSGLTRLAKTVAMPEAEEVDSRNINFPRETCDGNMHASDSQDIYDSQKIHEVDSHLSNIPHIVNQTVDSRWSQAASRHSVNMETNHRLLPQVELTHREANDGCKSSDRTDVDGWGDDDFSIDDDMSSEQSVRDPSFAPLVSHSSQPAVLNNHLQIETRLKSVTAQVCQTTEPNSPPLDPCTEVGKVPTPRLVSSTHSSRSSAEPTFHYIAADDIIPTRQRWINNRMLAS
jgi:hypothetical protein